MVSIYFKKRSITDYTKKELFYVPQNRLTMRWFGWQGKSAELEGRLLDTTSDMEAGFQLSAGWHPCRRFCADRTEKDASFTGRLEAPSTVVLPKFARVGT